MVSGAIVLPAGVWIISPVRPSGLSRVGKPLPQGQVFLATVQSPKVPEAEHLGPEPIPTQPLVQREDNSRYQPGMHIVQGSRGPLTH
jgi:hypothetical protein